MSKIALITGITGQDGAYLAALLLEKGYQVHGIRRRSSLFNTERIDHLYEGPITFAHSLELHYGDMTDGPNLARIVSAVKPDEIYNLAAQSHVAVSFETPEYTADVDGLGPLRLLEAIRICGLSGSCKFYQASTSEMFGGKDLTPLSEGSPFNPRSPYAAAKLFAYWITRNYREAYGIHASNGILFNHESPLRGETFVSRKITRALTRIKLGLQECLYLGNLNARRDWGHAKDYVEMMWRMMQLDKPIDLVIATGKQYTVREFVALAAQRLDMQIVWQGSGASEFGMDSTTGRRVIAIDQRYFRPTEVDYLLGDAALAQEVLGWRPERTFEDLVDEMIRHDFQIAKKEKIYREAGNTT